MLAKRHTPRRFVIIESSIKGLTHHLFSSSNGDTLSLIPSSGSRYPKASITDAYGLRWSAPLGEIRWERDSPLLALTPQEASSIPLTWNTYFSASGPIFLAALRDPSARTSP